MILSLPLVPDGLDLCWVHLGPPDRLMFVIQPMSGQTEFGGMIHRNRLYKMFPINCLFYLCGINWFSIPIAAPCLLLHMRQRGPSLFSAHSSMYLASCLQHLVPIFPRAHTLKHRPWTHCRLNNLPASFPGKKLPLCRLPPMQPHPSIHSPIHPSFTVLLKLH